MFWDIDCKCYFSKHDRCTACNMLSIECDGRDYIFCEQFRIATSASIKEKQDDGEDRPGEGCQAHNGLRK